MCVAVERVEQKEHNMNDSQLTVTVLEGLTDDLCDQECAVRVINIPAQLSQDYIECYFENERRSGGGTIEDISYSQSTGVAVITFTNPQGTNVHRCSARAKRTLFFSKSARSLTHFILWNALCILRVNFI